MCILTGKRLWQSFDPLLLSTACTLALPPPVTRKAFLSALNPSSRARSLPQAEPHSLLQPNRGTSAVLGVPSARASTAQPSPQCFTIKSEQFCWEIKYNAESTCSSLQFRGKCLTPVLITHGNRGNTGTLKYPAATCQAIWEQFWV